jgi:hypothetical protein
MPCFVTSPISAIGSCISIELAKMPLIFEEINLASCEG